MKKAMLFWALLGLVGFTSCETKYQEHDAEALGLDYLPVNIGDYKVYKVVDIKYQFNVATKDSFEMKEVVDTSFYDQTYTLTYKIIRSIKRYNDTGWVEDSVMTLTKSDKYALLTKDNTKYVKLVFPIKEGKIWYADAFNDRLTSNDTKIPHRYINVGKPYDLNGVTYPSTLTVDQNSSPNSVLIDNRNEVYAKGIGKIYRVFNKVVLASCATDDCVYGPDYKLDGHERYESLIDYGTL
ncbi:hypothetical protein [Pontibacter sp. H249]|uniref:hypothetical protein n=1 Tax=Pontibacter sp. H249 TaxID=3133420 RepID=UPI0030BE20B0